MPEGVDFGRLLTQRYAGIPGWLLAAGIGGAVYFIFIRGKTGSASSAPTASDQSSGFVAGYQQGYAQGAQRTVPAQSGAQPAPAPAYQPPPSQSPALRPRIRDVTGDPTGTGGAGRSSSIGNRSLDPHAYFHPAMTRKVRYAHYIRSGAGGVGHSLFVHRTAHTAGIHPARLQALNPVPHGGMIRIA